MGVHLPIIDMRNTGSAQKFSQKSANRPLSDLGVLGGSS
jgi:hypothetical protein